MTVEGLNKFVNWVEQNYDTSMSREEMKDAILHHLDGKYPTDIMGYLFEYVINELKINITIDYNFDCFGWKDSLFELMISKL